MSLVITRRAARFSLVSLAAMVATTVLWLTAGTLGCARSGQPRLHRNSDEPKASRAIRVEIGSMGHAGITAYTIDRLSSADLQVILDWLKDPPRTGSDTLYHVDPAVRAVVLAYERDGKPITGREGLIQLVVGSDQFASRYSHWVSAVRVH